MATSVQIWRPDTCGCEFYIAFDRDTGEWSDTPVRSTVCADHQGHTPHSATHLDAILNGENRVKNRIFGHAVDSIPALTETMPDGSKRQRVEDFDWHFDEARRLHYALHRGTPAQHTQIDAKVAKDFGTKVARVTPGQLQVMRAEMQLKKQQ